MGGTGATRLTSPIETGALPLLVTVTARLALAVPIGWLPNAIDMEATATTGVVPVPDRATLALPPSVQQQGRGLGAVAERCEDDSDLAGAARGDGAVQPLEGALN